MENIALNTTNYSLLEQSSPATILAVDDDIISMGFLESQVETLGHKVIKAGNGQEAITLLQNNSDHIDVILMDREMPVMDGLTAIRYIKENPLWRHIPVIMITGADSAEEINEGINAGVFYYLSKPVEDSTLDSVLSAAIKEARQGDVLASELSQHRSCFHLIRTCQFDFSTLEETKSLAAFIANCFPDPPRVLQGLGELLINAVEHGNLGIGYDKKTELVTTGIWEAEIDRMQQLPENKDKKASATIARKENGIYVIIEDQGEGFDWNKYMHIDHARAGDNHGRGIAQANAVSFNKLTYNDKGNKVIAFVNIEDQLEW